MPDISMCANEDCPIKQSCYRYTAIANASYQSYAEFEYKNDKDKCDYFWQNWEKEEGNNGSLE